MPMVFAWTGTGWVLRRATVPRCTCFLPIGRTSSACRLARCRSPGSTVDSVAPVSGQEQLIDLLLRIGLIEERDAAAFADAVQRTIDGAGASFNEHNLVGLAQAFGRGVERIALAGADAAARNLKDVPEAERDERLAAWLDAVLGPSTDAFSILFARRLEHLARRRLAAPPSDDDVSSTLDVAFVDLCGSTALHAAQQPGGHPGARGRPLRRRAGDGRPPRRRRRQVPRRRRDVPVGRSRAAAGGDCEATTLLIERTPLGAGAGIARGRVVRRGGDWFGTPVNLAARLAEVAESGEVLVDDEAQCAGLRAESWRSVLPRGLPDGRRVAVVRARR